MNCIDDLIKSKITNDKKNIVKCIIELLKDNKIDIVELQNSSYYTTLLKNSKDQSIYEHIIEFLDNNMIYAYLIILCKDNFFKKYNNKEKLLNILYNNKTCLESADYILFTYHKELEKEKILKNHIENKLFFTKSESELLNYYLSLKYKFKIVDIDNIVSKFEILKKIVEEYKVGQCLKNF